MANGLKNSAPSPLDNAIGKSPKMVVKAVIKIGRNLLLPPIFIAA